MTCAGGSGLGQQLLDDHFRLLVFAFAEVVMPDVPLRVGDAGELAEPSKTEPPDREAK
jgi:hypothetical protein